MIPIKTTLYKSRNTYNITVRDKICINVNKKYTLENKN